MLHIRTAAMMLGGLILVGCQGNGSTTTSAAASGDVLDVHPSPAAMPVQVYTPAAAAPLTPMMASDSLPAASATSTPVAAGSATHVVARGETLYSIARISYGSGKQWQRIAAANPGVNPSGLKVGQTLNMP